MNSWTVHAREEIKLDSQIFEDMCKDSTFATQIWRQSFALDSINSRSICQSEVTTETDAMKLFLPKTYKNTYSAFQHDTEFKINLLENEDCRSVSIKLVLLYSIHQTKHMMFLYQKLEFSLNLSQSQSIRFFQQVHFQARIVSVRLDNDNYLTAHSNNCTVAIQIWPFHIVTANNYYLTNNATQSIHNLAELYPDLSQLPGKLQMTAKGTNSGTPTSTYQDWFVFWFMKPQLLSPNSAARLCDSVGGHLPSLSTTGQRSMVKDMFRGSIPRMEQDTCLNQALCYIFIGVPGKNMVNMTIISVFMQPIFLIIYYSNSIFTFFSS